jgi:steroid delta-isomerase-like uncharacterized protein
MSQENKNLLRRTFEEVMNRGNLNFIDQVFASDFIGHDTTGGTYGVADFKQSVMDVLAAFPDCQITIEDQLSDGDKVVTRWVGRGHHQGEYMGVPATGKYGSMMGISIDRIAGERIVESWEITDDAGMMRQLGVIPELTEAGTQS